MDYKIETSFLKRYRFVWHILFWASFWMYEGFVWGTIDNNYEVRFMSSLIELPVKIIATYFTIYFLIDNYLLKKKYISFLLFLLISMIGFGILLRIIAYHSIYVLYYPEALNIPLFFIPKILIAIFSIYSIVGLVTTFHLIKHAYKGLKQNQQLKEMAQELENEKLEAELKLLKSQINPHFLFNTLNNLYVLSLNKSSKAPETVYKLSQLMHYMLYESNQEEVPIEDEIEYIQNYITLEKIRYGERIDISLNVFLDIKDIKIPPLLLIPFIENCFKHGINNQIEEGWVRIDILNQQNNLVLKVENSRCSYNVEAVKTSPKSGIGLKNVKKRLDLIYGNQYNMEIFDEEESFLAVLKINLNEKQICLENKMTTVVT